MSPRPRKSPDELEDILTITVSLIAEYGLNNIRYAQISAKAGVSVGTLQHYFGSLEDLLIAAFDYYDSEQAPLARAVGSPDADQWTEAQTRLDRMVEVRDVAAVALMWARILEPGHDFGRLREEGMKSYNLWIDEFRELIIDGKKVGRFQFTLPVNDLTDAVSALMDGLGQSIAIGRIDPRAARRIAKGAVATLLDVAEDTFAR